MGMFKNYHNIADNYIPNNLIHSFITAKADTKLVPVDASSPFEEYDTKGNLVGYSWRQGETLNLEFNIDGEIVVESDAVIITSKGVTPTQDTLGYIGQSLYNIVDFRLWKCDAILKGKYIWNEYSFEYPENGDRKVYVSAEDYLKDKSIEITLYNFRHEPIKKIPFTGSSRIVLSIDKELSNLMSRGIYYCSVTVSNPIVSYTIFDFSDGYLLVK